MICPNCQNACGERDHFCCRCGSPLQEAVPAKKGALWVPVLILILLSAIGIAVFFCTAPGKRHAHSSADAPWFAVQNGVLYFDESRYAGSGELSVPNQVDGETVTSLSDGCFRNYFDDKGDLVIVFEKYDVAPGYMGCPEFVIPREVYQDGFLLSSTRLN